MRAHGLPIYLSDAFPMCGAPRPPAHLGGTTGGVHLQVPDVDAAFARAVAAGAAAAMPPADMFWGDRYAKVIDPFGHHWSFAARREHLTAARTQARANEMFKTSTPAGAGANSPT